jgi:uncharacterized protein YabE (DUF348 family)
MKLGLYGLVLAGLLGGTAAWVGEGKSVSLTIDGRQQRVHTNASSVQGVLKSAHVSVGEHDLIAPDPSSKISNGGRIVIDRGHLLHLTVNGVAREVWVNADSVAQALAQLGYGTENLVSVSRSKRLDTGVTDVSITSPRRVVLKVDGKTIALSTAGPTVAQAVKDSGIYLAPNDRVSPAKSSKIHNNEVIVISRVTYGSTVEQANVPYSVTKQNDPSNYVGVDSVATQGKNGLKRITYQLLYVDGKLAGKVVKSSVTLSAPVNEIDKIGSKPATAVPAGDAQQIAAGMVSARGWGNDQFSCLVSLWSKESGWRTDAANPSGAYGIPQALPGSKMASAGADWQTNAATQITWGLNYISGVYGTPCSAWAHSQATNWY